MIPIIELCCRITDNLSVITDDNMIICGVSDSGEVDVDVDVVVEAVDDLVYLINCFHREIGRYKKTKKHLNILNFYFFIFFQVKSG